MGELAPPPRLVRNVNVLTCYVKRRTGPVSRRQVATSGAVVLFAWRAAHEGQHRGSSSHRCRRLSSG